MNDCTWTVALSFKWLLVATAETCAWSTECSNPTEAPVATVDVSRQRRCTCPVFRLCEPDTFAGDFSEDSESLAEQMRRGEQESLVEVADCREGVGLIDIKPDTKVFCLKRHKWLHTVKRFR